ncbi:MAG: lipoate--protein ligase [Eubacteriales bacterium]
MKRLFYMSPRSDGHLNLSVDEYLLDTLSPDDFILYLYINENDVIIGRNQNAWKECNIAKMEADGVRLVRRVSGGGAVYHDIGNLNFSFITGEQHYDLERQTEMILAAVRHLGIEAEFSGRNDITVNGRKFSGNAFAMRRQNRQHHGTLLINADLSRLSDYLNVPEQKIRAKGVESVRARVCNLTDINPALTVEMAVEALKKVYREHYGEFETLSEDLLDKEKINDLYKKHSSWEWRMGSAPVFDYEVDTRFEWGGVQLYMSMENGTIRGVQVYTDALNTQIPQIVGDALTGVLFRSDDMADSLRAATEDTQIHQLAEYLRGLRL